MSLTLRPTHLCWICLFELKPGIEILPRDLAIDASFEREYQIDIEDVNRSIGRRCETCHRISRFVTRFSTGCRFWRWSYVFRWTEHHSAFPLQVTDGDGSYTSFIMFPVHEPSVVQDKRLEDSRYSSRLVTGGTFDETAFATVSQWLAICRTEHESCSRMPTFVPTRLLYIGTGDKNVIQLRENLHGHIKYGTLSYRWGSDNFKTQLEVKNHVQRLAEGIGLAGLPQLFRDVIYVFHRLGVAYLWIDSMCIIQDSTKDWQKEANLMADVYSNAEFTISATWCQNSGQSLFNSARAAADLEQEIGCNHGRQMAIRYCFPHPSNTIRHANPNDEAEFPLNLRGWVYQEQYLSRRTISFTRHEISWSCQDSLACQCGYFKFGVPNALNNPVYNAYKSKSWWEIIEEYSARQLSFESDRLPALAGIARQWHRQYGSAKLGQYICGLWEYGFRDNSVLMYCLLWQASRMQARSKVSSPSWSWASIREGVGYQKQSRLRLDGVDAVKTIEILDIVVDYIGSPFMGNVARAELMVSAMLIPATLYTLAKANEFDTSCRFKLCVNNQYAMFVPDYLLSDLQQEHNASPLCILLFWHATKEGRWLGSKIEAEGLVLRCVDDLEARYERVGYFWREYWADGAGVDTLLSAGAVQTLTLI